MIQVYTGAALGLALRAVGAGLKVYIGQFVKGKNYNRINTFKKLSILR